MFQYYPSNGYCVIVSKRGALTRSLRDACALEGPTQNADFIAPALAGSLVSNTLDGGFGLGAAAQKIRENWHRVPVLAWLQLPSRSQTSSASYPASMRTGNSFSHQGVVEEGWTDAATVGAAPLKACTNEYRQKLADVLPSSWSDAKAATVVATAVMALNLPTSNVPTTVGETKVTKLDPWSDPTIVANAEDNGASVTGCVAPSSAHPELISCGASATCITNADKHVAFCPDGYGIDEWYKADIDDLSVYDEPEPTNFASSRRDDRRHMVRFLVRFRTANPAGFGSWSGSCSRSDAENVVLWSTPESDVDESLVDWLFLTSNSDGYLRVAVGYEGEEPDLVAVATVYF